MKVSVTLEGYYTEKVAKKVVEVMQGKTMYNFDVAYSNQAGNCMLVVTTDYIEENDYDTLEEARNALEESFMYYTLVEFVSKTLV